MLVALLPTLKMFLPVDINLEVTEAAAHDCSLKMLLTKILKMSHENTSAGISFLKKKTKRQNFEFPQIFSEHLFWRLPVDGCLWTDYLE